MPGRYTTDVVPADEPGEYHLFCAEYCGTEHSRMIGRVVVMEPADTSVGSRRQRGDSHRRGRAPAVSRDGLQRVSRGSTSSARRVLAGVYGKPVPLDRGEVVTADEAYLRDSILLPGKQIVAGYRTDHADVAGGSARRKSCRFIAYIKSLGDRAAGDTMIATALPRQCRDSAARCAGELSERRTTASRSWLLTTDHKRIAHALLWSRSLCSSSIGGVAATMMRLELLTPQGDLVRPRPTTGCSRCTA